MTTNLKSFLSIGELPKETLNVILEMAEKFIHPQTKRPIPQPLLLNKTVVNLFFENSTRTRSTFELAGKLLSANILNLQVDSSSVKKGESLSDMLDTIQAMGIDLFVIRHNLSGATHFISSMVSSNVGVINAGDGSHSHPTQALLDMMTIIKHKVNPHGIELGNLKVAIVGDIAHSRVARSLLQVLKTFEIGEIRLVAPQTLLPDFPEAFQVQTTSDMRAGISDVDVIIMLRIQEERMRLGLFPSRDWYFKKYGLTVSKLKCAKKNAIVMHPGPINRGYEIASEVADGPQSVILNQVSYGIAIRMAVMTLICQSLK